MYCVFSSFSLTRLSPFFSNSSLEFRGMFSGVSGGNLAVGSASAQVWQSHRFAHCAFHWARSLGSPLEPEARRKENRHMSETHVDTRTQQNPNSNSALNPRGTTSRTPMHFPMLHPCCIHTRNQTTSVSFGLVWVGLGWDSGWDCGARVGFSHRESAFPDPLNY